jgi:rhodanese-related sulfurtransferase
MPRLLPIILGLLLVAFSAQAEVKVRDIDSAALAALIGRGVPVVDIRTPPEWRETGTIAGVHRIMAFDEKGKLAPDFLSRLAQVAGPDQEVVLICRSGNRTKTLGTALAGQLGYSRLHNVEKGMVRWMADGRPVEK